MKGRMKNWLRPALFTLGGGLAGFAYYTWVGCAARILCHHLQSVLFGHLHGPDRLASLRRVRIRQLSEKQQTINRILKQNSRQANCLRLFERSCPLEQPLTLYGTGYKIKQTHPWACPSGSAF